MRRPASITASAVVAFLGSILAMLLGALAGASVFVAPAAPRPDGANVSIVSAAILLVTAAAVGIWTAVGLFQLRPWARISILVIAGFLAVGSIPSLLMSLVVPIPPDIGPDGTKLFRVAMTAVFGLPLVVAIWWLILFNRTSTKAVFATAFPAEPPIRPVSVTFIGWSCIAGAFVLLGPAVARTPAFIFGAILNGWQASAFYIFFWVASLYIGRGLLELREHARILAIAWFAYPIVHFALVELIPPMRQRMLDMQRQATASSPAPPVPFDPVMAMTAMFVLSMIVGGIAIWFLVRNRAAFKHGPIEVF